MLEFQTMIIDMNADLQGKLEELTKQGWFIVPGNVPKIIYPLARIAGQEVVAMGKGFGKLTIDETKLYFIDKDGNRQERINGE